VDHVARDEAPAGAVDGAIDTAAAQKARVRGVHDRIHVLAREVANLDDDRINGVRHQFR